MGKKGLILGLIFFVVGAFSANAEDLGIPIFGDNFNIPGLFIENWEPTVGIKSDDGVLNIPDGGKIRLRRKAEGSFAISLDIAVEKVEGVGCGFAGLYFDSIKFAVREDGRAWVVYRLPGEKYSKGHIFPIDDFEFGKSMNMTVSRRLLDGAAKYVYKINNQTIASFIESGLPREGRIKIMAWRLSCVIDNFQLYTLKDKDVSPNLAVNSSFEYLQEGMPTFFDSCTFRPFEYKGPLEDFFKTWRIDTDVKHSGKQSLRIENDPLVGARNSFLTFNTGITIGKPMVFSLYLKASEAGLPVTLKIWEMRVKFHRKEIKLSTEWQRFEFLVENPIRSTVRCGLWLEVPGVVWVDDIQIEIGETASKYQASSLDAVKFYNKKEVVTRPEDIKLVRLSQKPIIDGNLEDIWFKEATKVDQFLFKGTEKPRDKTIAYLGYYEGNLYIAFQCYVEDATKIRAEKFPHDNVGLFGQDCIEIFLDSTFSREKYLQIGVNAANSRADIGPGRILGWDGEWQSAVKIDKEKNVITFEVQLPLAMLAEADISNRWGINLGRNSIASNQASSLIHFPRVDFHQPEYYPTLVWPEGILEKFALGVSEFQVSYDRESNKTTIFGKIVNNSSQGFKGDIQLFDQNTKALLGSQVVQLKKGDNAVQIPLSLSVTQGAIDVTIKILRDGQLRHVSSLRAQSLMPLEIFTRLNFYMNEPNAVIVGNLRLPDAKRLKGVVTVGEIRKEVALSDEFTIEIPLQGLALGKHEVKLDIFDGARKVLQGQTTLVKKAFVEGAVQIDRQRRCLIVDGKPFLVIAPLIVTWPGQNDEPENIKRIVEFYKSHGFKTLMIYGNYRRFPAIKYFLRYAEEAGLKTINWAKNWHSRDKISMEEIVKAWESDSTIAWLAIDEPELYAESDEVRDFLTNFRKYTPYHPTFMNNTIVGIPGRFADLNTDILMVSDYLTNREGREVEDIIKSVDMMWEAGKEGRKPCFFFLVGNNMHNHYREPTFAEQMAQSYASVISGASGLVYFLGRPNYPENWRALKQLNAELLSLQDVIFSLEKTPSASISNRAIRFMTRKLNDKIYVIAVNLTARDVDVEIIMPMAWEYQSDVTVQFEDRTIKLNNSRFNDTFKAHERRVYYVYIK